MIDNKGKIKPAYLKDIYTGRPGFVIPLSKQFNELVDEESVSPDFQPLKDLGYKVEFRSWNPEKRNFHSDNAYDSKEGYYRSIIVYPEDEKLDLIEDPMLKGLENTLLPMVADMQSDMEKQLDTEIKRLQKLQSRSPK